MSSLRRKAWTISMRDSELLKVKRAAAEDEERPSTWARQVLLKEAERVLRQPREYPQASSAA